MPPRDYWGPQNVPPACSTHLSLAVVVPPGARQHARQLRGPPHDLVVHRDRRGPPAVAALLGVLQAQKRCGSRGGRGRQDSGSEVSAQVWHVQTVRQRWALQDGASDTEEKWWPQQADEVGGEVGLAEKDSQHPRHLSAEGPPTPGSAARHLLTMSAESLCCSVKGRRWQGVRVRTWTRRRRRMAQGGGGGSVSNVLCGAQEWC